MYKVRHFFGSETDIYISATTIKVLQSKLSNCYCINDLLNPGTSNVLDRQQCLMRQFQRREVTSFPFHVNFDLVISILFILLGNMSSFLALSVFACLAYCQQWSIGQLVKTTSGEIKGHPSSWKPTVSEYLGIPYAQPPVGNLRWAAPKPFSSNKPLEAAKFSATCLSNINTTPNGTITYGDFKKTLLGVVGQVEGRSGIGIVHSASLTSLI